MHLLLVHWRSLSISNSAWPSPYWSDLSQVLHWGTLARIHSINEICVVWLSTSTHDYLVLVFFDVELTRTIEDFWRALWILTARILVRALPAILLFVATSRQSRRSEALNDGHGITESISRLEVFSSQRIVWLILLIVMELLLQLLEPQGIVLSDGSFYRVHITAFKAPICIISWKCWDMKVIKVLALFNHGL